MMGQLCVSVYAGRPEKWPLFVMCDLHGGRQNLKSSCGMYR